MKTAEIQALPAPPSLIGSLMAGFDATANHIDLILIPIVLDLFLWFGPHLRLKQLVDSLIQILMQQSGSSDAQNDELLQAGSQFWQEITESLNMFTSLRTFPVGVPSLMGSSQPLTTPLGQPVIWEVESFWWVIAAWLVISFIGLAIGTIYFSGVSQAAVNGSVSWRLSFNNWLWEVTQVIFLALFWGILLVALTIPASCLFSILMMTGVPFGELGVIIIGGLMIWFLFPLLFSPHGIFVNHSRMWPSVKNSIRIIRITMPKTMLFFLIILLVDEGFTLLWQVPGNNSWLAFVGVIGHAFVSTGLVAASFIYYKDAARWLQRLNQQAQLASRA